jgi:GNAT superfamily N-acetyltransferase
MSIAEYRWDDYVISTDQALLDLDVIQGYLSERSYWAQGRPLAVTQKAIENSLCFGVYEGEAQVGFARVVTDYATFAWLADVFILESHRGRGLAKWLVQCVVAHPDLQGLRQIILATRDAHELYRKYAGFQPVPPDRFMSRRAT